jgi:hypothetical protein
LGWTYTVRSVGCGLAIGWRAFWTVSMLMPGSFEPEYQLKKELAQILEAAIRDAKIPLVPNVVIGSPGGQGGTAVHALLGLLLSGDIKRQEKPAIA